MPKPVDSQPCPAHVADALRDIAIELSALEARQRDLYADRLALWTAARTMKPKVLVEDIAIASRTTRGAVAQALRKQRIEGVDA